jgi:hypothetical protein
MSHVKALKGEWALIKAFGAVIEARQRRAGIL